MVFLVNITVQLISRRIINISINTIEVKSASFSVELNFVCHDSKDLKFQMIGTFLHSLVIFPNPETKFKFDAKTFFHNCHANCCNQMQHSSHI